MAVASPLLDTCALKFGGSDAPEEMLRSIEEVIVEDNLNLPTVMTLVLADGTIARIYARYGVESRPPQ